MMLPLSLQARPCWKQIFGQNLLFGTAPLLNKPVVYFDQRLGAAHTKCKLKYAFCAKNKKNSKSEKFVAEFNKKRFF